jgi:lysophospholipase L1-like esterase
VPDLLARFDRDVLAAKPTVVVVYIGINDVWHSKQGRGTSSKDFEKGLRDLVARIQAIGARPILCTPSVIGEKADGSNELDAMLDEYSAISRRVAGASGVQLLDLRQRFLGWLRQHNKDKATQDLLTTDGVHLNAAGNRLVADAMVEALGIPPAAKAR